MLSATKSRALFETIELLARHFLLFIDTVNIHEPAVRL